jgi:hypothetical protein
MPSYEQDDVFGSSQYLSSPSAKKPTRSPSRGTLRASASPLKQAGGSLADAMIGMDDGFSDSRASGFSLAHELAAALMPEPSAGSRLLDEFGIDYDEGAEGIDGDALPEGDAEHAAGANSALEEGITDPAFTGADPAFAEPMTRSTSLASELTDDPAFSDPDTSLGSPAPKRRTAPTPASPGPAQDPMDVLSRDLAATEAFLFHLRRIDVDASASASTITPTTSSFQTSATATVSSSPLLEQVAGNIIRRINDAARDREGQVRALRECERELRKIGGEVGGEDVLGSLDELEGVEELHEELHPRSSTSRQPEKEKKKSRTEGLPTVDEDDWEAQIERERLLAADPDGDGDGEDEDARGPSTPQKDTFSLPPPPPAGPPTPSVARAELAYLRALTGSLVSSLSAISEQTQVTGAATADAGRRLRALKHKMGGVQSDWEGAERSRGRIERWEAGLADTPEGGTPGYMPSTPGRSRRVDGRKIVAEHMRAFEAAITEASGKTQLIMAAVA